MSGSTSTAPSLSPDCRARITRQYVRSMAVIDDSIFTEGDPQRISGFFDDLRRSCDEDGILCHLHQFVTPAPNADGDEVRKRVSQAAQLANIADVVILDWHLNSRKGRGGSPEQALEILQELGQSSALRFVVIYTDLTDLDHISETLLHEIDGLEPLHKFAVPDAVGEAAEEDEEPALAVDEQPDDVVVYVEEDPPANAGEVRHDYHLNRKLFLFIRAKRSVEPSGLILDIYETLEESFPDFLHWAALEMAAGVRNLLPTVIAALPADTDGALRLQQFYQKDGEIADRVAGIVLDELRFAVHAQPLTAVADDQLFASTKRCMNTFCSDREALNAVLGKVEPSWPDAIAKIAGKEERGQHLSLAEQGIKQVLGDLPGSWADPDLAAIRDSVATKTAGKSFFPCKPEDPKGICTAIARYLEDDDALDTYTAWAQACESVLLPPTPGMVSLGYVLRRRDLQNVGNGAQQQAAVVAEDLQAPPDWLLCITPACDCYRPKGHGYLFVSGSSIPDGPDPKSILGQTQTCTNGNRILWDASQLVIRKDPFEQIDAEPAYEVFGALRYDFAMRVINRVWAYQSRVGVDTSEYVRLLRGE